MTERPVHGLNFTVGYTYSHSLDQISNDWNANVPMYSGNPKLDYGNSNYDLRHRLTVTTTYALPEKRSFAQLLQGWQLNSIANVQSGLPWNLVDNTSDVSGTGEYTDRWNFFGNPSDFSGRGATPIPWFPGSGASANQACVSQAVSAGAAAVSALSKWGCYVAGSSMLLPPALGTLGTMGRNIFRANGLHLLDLSVTKKWKFTERLNAQFRAEFFNILNITQYANPTYNGVGHNIPTSTTAFGSSTTTPDVAIDNAQIGSGAARSMQLGLKLIF